MSLLGAALVAAGSAGAVWGVSAASSRRRPVDVIAALIAPVGVVVALVGAVLLFVPGFFG